MIVETEFESVRVPGYLDVAVALLDGVGRVDFQDRVVEALREHIAFDASLAVIYRKGCIPRILLNDWRTDEGPAAALEYLQNCCQRPVSGTGAGNVHQLRQLRPADGRNVGGKEICYQSGVCDALGIVVKLNDESMYALLLARREKHPDFGDRDLAILQAAMPLLGTAVIRHYRDFHSRWQERQQLLQLALKQAVGNFGRSALTNRECQVAQMILRGHTARETATQLGITPATVKLHRRHIYSKLDVTSQSALFSLFLDAACSAKSLSEDPLTGYLPPR